MPIEIVPLGTGAAIPMKDRHLSALVLAYEGRMFLFDCGEGTQLQLMRAGISSHKIGYIFITHLHGDHYFGLLGLISTLTMLGRKSRLTVVGPVGIESIMCAIPGFEREKLPFDLQYVELQEGLSHEVVVEGKDFYVEARPLEHRIQAVGYRFQERARPGKFYPDRALARGVTDVHLFGTLKAGTPVTLASGGTVHPREVLGPERPGASFAYVTDTRPCAGGVELARRADLVYHEATFTGEFERRAIETGHSTAKEAASVAKEAEARALLLGHVSARFSDPSVLLDEARTIFQNTELAEELKRYSVYAHVMEA